MKSARLEYLVARTHGFRSHLLPRQDLVRLLTSQELDEMVSILLQTDYGNELSRIADAKPTAIHLERIFREKLSTRWYLLPQVISGKISRIIEEYCARLEIENLKEIIRSIHGRHAISTEELIKIPRRYQRVNFPAVVMARTIDEFARLLNETPYASLQSHVQEYQLYANPILLEAHLDATYYSGMWNHVSKRRYRKTLRPLIGTEVDLKNLELILTGKYLKLEQALIRTLLVKASYRLPKTDVVRLMSRDISELPEVQIYQPYSGLLRRAVDLLLDDKAPEMQTVFPRYLFAYASKMMVRHPNALSYVLAYMQLCLREEKNLTTLAVGKQFKTDQERLMLLLLL
jgi:V/A-type H+-transporting ATPase subunit C